MGTLVLTGATSGSATLTPVDAVTAVITLPSATATLATLGANTFTGTQTLTGGGSGGLILGYGGISTYGAIWSNQVSPSTSNYALFARADTTQINVPTGGAIYLGINTSTTLQVNATGAAVTGTLGVTTSVDITGSNGARSLSIKTGGFQSFYDSTNTEQARIQTTAGGLVMSISNIGSGSLGITGNTAITGSLSKSSGTFKIDHPLAALTDTHQLVHSFIEGPQADLIYRGKVLLVDGKATVNIDAAATMTDGTFDVLCRDVQCFTTNESDWTPVRGAVVGNILTIESQDPAATSSISWMVIGERKDKHMMETDWTDDNGKVIVEPVKLEAK